MAIPVESWQAAGGEIDVGDQVDVIDTGDERPALRVDRARRWSAGRPRTPPAGWSASNSGELWIAVEVTAAEALELASVIDGDEFVLVRSTGATDEAPASATPSGLAVSAPMRAARGRCRSDVGGWLMAARAALRVGAVLSSEDWWRRLNAHAADHGSDVEVVVVRDAHAVLESGLQVVCTDDTVVWFTRAMVSQAEAAGITVVGVRSAGDDRQ